MHILRVTWDNQVIEIFRSDLAGADFVATIPHCVEAKELGYSLGSPLEFPATKSL